MIRIEKEALTNAAHKAAAERCSVKVEAFKRYTVISPRGTSHTVEFKLMWNGWYGKCDCRSAAFFHSCFHLIPAYFALRAHCYQRDEAARQRSQARPCVAAGVLVKSQPASAGRLNGFEL